LDVHAIDPRSVARIGAAQHRLCMTVARSGVDSVGTTRAPDLTIIAPGDLKPSELELAVWDLGGQDVRIVGGAEIRWAGSKTLLANLGQLTRRQSVGRNADRAMSMIHLPGGAVTPRVLGKTYSFGFVPYKDPSSAPSHAQQLADIVDVLVEGNGSTLTIEIRQRGSSSPVQKISIRAGSSQGTSKPPVVSFSNLCTSPPQQGVDKEFAALYEAIENPPPVPDRLIPTAISTIAEFPCYALAYFQY